MYFYKKEQHNNGCPPVWYLIQMWERNRIEQTFLGHVRDKRMRYMQRINTMLT